MSNYHFHTEIESLIKEKKLCKSLCTKWTRELCGVNGETSGSSNKIPLTSFPFSKPFMKTQYATWWTPGPFDWNNHSWSAWKTNRATALEVTFKPCSIWQYSGLNILTMFFWAICHNMFDWSLLANGVGKWKGLLCQYVFLAKNLLLNFFWTRHV